MNYLFWILVGIIIGWVIEWVIDWLFWRKPDGKALEKLAIAEGENSRLQSRLAESEQKVAQLETENGRLQTLTTNSAGVGLAGHQAPTRQAHLADVDATLLQSRPAPKDRLEEIDGIGPVYARRLNEAGLFSFWQLAHMTPEQVHELIDPQDWQKIDAASWIAQATVMASPDNLEEINGIGAVFALRLNEAGIYTFAQLAELLPARVREIIQPETWQKIEPESWIAEAGDLAAEKSDRTITGA